MLNEKDEKDLNILSKGDEIMGLYDEEMHLENLRISERKEEIENL